MGLNSMFFDSGFGQRIQKSFSSSKKDLITSETPEGLRGFETRQTVELADHRLHGFTAVRVLGGRVRIGIICFAALASATSFGQDLIDEPFNVDGTMTQGVYSDWTSTSGTGAQLTVTAADGLAVGASDRDYSRSFTAQSGLTYFGLDLDVTLLPSSGQEYILHFNDGSGFDARYWMIARNSGAAFDFGLSVNSNTLAVSSTSNFSLDSPLRLVGGYNPGTDAVTLWAGSYEINSPLLSTTGTDTSTTTNGFGIRQAGAFDNGAASYFISNLIISSNFYNAAGVPEPTAPSLTWYGDGSTAGGSGTWSEVGSQWSNDEGATFTTWDSGQRAVFDNLGGVVSVGPDGINAAAGLAFEANGYTVSGGRLTLSGPDATANAILVSVGTTSIESELSGSGGLSKTGSGTLVLTGPNTFSGTVGVEAGTLRIGGDSAFGDVFNDLVINGTLAIAGDVSLAASRDITGSSTLDIAPGTTLTVNGAFNSSATTLANAGTLSLAGATPSVGALAMSGAGTLNASAGSISATTITAADLAGGTATIDPNINFSTTGNKSINVAAGTLVLGGDISSFATSSNSYIFKTGDGTLALQGSLLPGSSSASGGLQIGFAGSSPTNGGTVIISEAGSAGDGNSQLRINYGTLRTDAAGGLIGPNAIAAGLNVGGRVGAVAVIDGTEPIEFSGQSSFFRSSGTSGEFRLDVNNETTLGGGFAATSGSGTATGITLGGAGKLTLAGDGAALTEALTLQDTLQLTIDGSTGGNVTVGSTNVLTGTGTIGGIVGGAGSVQPGASPGILTVGQVDPSGGTSFVLEYTGALPDYSNATASGNDVTRVTGGTPFVQNMTSSNTVDLFLGVTSVTIGNSFEGGFFTDTPGDFTAAVADATLNYYVLGDGNGSDATLDGQGYYSFANWKSGFSSEPDLALSLGTIARTASFATGSVSGQAMVVSAVPEPSTVGLIAAATGLAAVALRRRRR